MSTVPIPVAPIHHRFFPGRNGAPARLLIAHAVESVAEARWHSVDEGAENAVRERIIETFVQMWQAHRDTGLILYVADPVVRRLLQQEASLFPGLLVREVVTGQRLQDNTRRCLDLFHAERATLKPRAKVAPFVVATDASRGFSGKLTGLGAATSTGEVAAQATKTPSILAGEFAAVDMALQKWWGESLTIHILTDCQAVWRRLNAADLGARNSRSSEEGLCVRQVHAVRARGVDVQVHWVRGHNGHLLNDYADRLAMAARRSVQFRLGADGDTVPARLRAELVEELRVGAELLPVSRSRDYRPAAKVG